MNKREFVIILSDIHIGTASPTVLYCKEVHEKYLVAIFDDIIACAHQIQELILLGDIFEFWSYPPNEIPPTLDDIIFNNPRILGPNGKLNQALSALNGRIVFIPGNHDINVTETDLKKIKNKDGYTIKFHSGSYIPEYDTGILFTHGNEFTLLNAPYYRSKLAPLPIGYFVSRAISYQVEKEIPKTTGLTIVNLKGYGSLNITDILKINPSLFKHYLNGSGFVNNFIDTIASVTGCSLNLPIYINRTTTVTLNDVKKIYIDLINEFPNQHLEFPNQDSKHDFSDRTLQLIALDNDFNGTYLPWLAQNYAFKTNTNIVVMGHTHVPISFLRNSKIQYTNTGFMCPSIPDMKTKAITYGIYNCTNRFVSLMEINGDSKYDILPYIGRSIALPINEDIINYAKSVYVEDTSNESNYIKQLSNQVTSYNNNVVNNNKLVYKTSAIASNIVETEIQKNTQSTTPNKKFTFGWSVYNESWEYYKTMQNGVLSKARELGIDIITHDQKSDSIEMLNGCFDLINKDVNALLISPYNPEEVPIIVADANIKKIPVVVIDGGTGGADVLAFIVSDSFAGGILAGEYALWLIQEYSIKSKNIAIIKAEKTATYALRRGQGFKSVMIESGYQVVAEVYANGEQPLAYEAMKNILSSFDNDLAVVFCENGNMTLGAASAIEEAGKTGQIMLIGFDADSAVIAAIKQGFVQGTIAQQPFKMGEIGVEIAYLGLLGKPISYDNQAMKEILMEVYLIDETGEPSLTFR